MKGLYPVSLLMIYIAALVMTHISPLVLAGFGMAVCSGVFLYVSMLDWPTHNVNVSMGEWILVSIFGVVSMFHPALLALSVVGLLYSVLVSIHKVRRYS